MPAIVDAGIRAEVHGRAHPLVGAGGRDHAGTQRLGRLDAGRSQAPGRAHHEDPLAGRELRHVAQDAERGGRVTGHDRRGHEVEAAAHRMRRLGGDLHVLGVAAPEVDAEHDGPGRGRRRPDDLPRHHALAHPGRGDACADGGTAWLNFVVVAPPDSKSAWLVRRSNVVVRRRCWPPSSL